MPTYYCLKKITLLVLLVLPLLISAQTVPKYTVSGYIKDEKTGEAIIGSIVTVKEIPGVGATSNAYGFYSITLPSGNYILLARIIGYLPNSENISLTQNVKHDFVMKESNMELGTIEVTGEKKNDNITKTQMGVEKIDMGEIKNIPVFMGERDLMKTIQLRPGVKSAGEGGSGFYVRGGTADQNLILLDEATIYNASHLLGFFSVFNTDALKDVTLYKGSQPAEYGGRLSSVLDVRMKEGNNKRFGAEGGIGLISSRLKIEGPIVKDKGSFTVSGRRTYADLFLKLSPDSTLNQAILYFYDLNCKGNYNIDSNNRIFLSGYFGKDVLGFGKTFGFDWGNASGTLRWNHLVNSKMFSNTSFIISNYNYNIHIQFGDLKAKIISRIQDYNLKQDFQYFPNTSNKIKFGFNSIYHQIIPGVITVDSGKTTESVKFNNNYGLENAIYGSHEYKLADQFSVEYGIRLSSYSAVGPGKFYLYNALGETTDTLNYKSGEFVKSYFNIEPRIGANFIINEFSSVKTGLGRNVQNMHLLSNSTSGNPTDLWIPSSNNVKPEIADQVSLGYFRNFKDNSYEFSIETYYKKLQNQIDYKNGAELNFNEKVESQLLFGSGRAYGIEFFLKKKYGKLTGWIGYTLARTEKKISGINNGNYYPAKQDRTHDVSVVGMYELNKKWTFSAIWVYYTGNAVTFPAGKYEVDGHVVNYYTERNGYRMPAYHRLDLGATWQIKKTETRESSWNFSVYNAYGRENAYSITFQVDPNDANKTQAVQTTLFRWVPAITYNFKF